MRIEISDKAKAYLAKKGSCHILVATYHWHGCTSSPEQDVQVISAERAEALKESGNVPCFTVDDIEVLIAQFWMPENEDAVISFDLQSFLGTSTIVAKGLRRPEVFF